MARKLLDHVIEKTDAGRHVELACPIEVQLDENVGLVGLAFYPGGAHAAPYNQLAETRNIFATCCSALSCEPLAP
jgi:hypothetical protein